MTQEETRSRFREIDARIERGEATVLTAEEMRRLVREKGTVSMDEVDVVTTATRALMSGTIASFSLPIAEPDAFVRAREIWLNGVPGYPGPAPNERLGLVDCTVYGTAHSRDRPDEYGGGHLFRDLVERKAVSVEVETIDDEQFSCELTLDDIPYAVLSAMRNCYRNYAAFVNPSTEPLRTIFSCSPLPGPYTAATVSGCGEINPLENDATLSVIGIGTRFLLNGAEGYVTGLGTRATREKPNLTGYADMHEMDPRFMGGFRTSAGPEVLVSWAVPIPVVSDAVLETLHTLDEEIPMKVVDLRGRGVVGTATYADVWQGTDHKISFAPDSCIRCERCIPEEICPTDAFHSKTRHFERSRCCHCGICVPVCPTHSFWGSMGELEVDGREIPIVLRQSDRYGANKLAELLKKKIVDGSFRLSYPLARLEPHGG